MTLELPSHLPVTDRIRLTALAERNLADHGDGFLGLVLSGSAGCSTAPAATWLRPYDVRRP